MQGESGSQAGAWLAGELLALADDATRLPTVALGVLPAADRITNALMTAGGGVACELSALSTRLASPATPGVAQVGPFTVSGIGFAVGCATADSLRAAVDSVETTAIDSAAAAWQRLTDDITTATDDGERSFGAGLTVDVHAQLVVADLRSLAARSALGARLLGAIGSGVRRLDAELSVLEQDWAAAQVLLASPAMAAACAGVLEVHQAKCRDAAARTYNAAVARWESLAAAGVGR